MKDNNLTDHVSLCNSLKIYESGFDMEDEENIFPEIMEGVDPLHDKKLNEDLKCILGGIFKIYEKRGVSFMFRESLLNHIS